MDKIDIIDNINTALLVLKQKKILILENSKVRTLIFMIEDKITINSVNSSYTLSINDFLHLFEYNTFYIYEEELSNIEAIKAKDDEYYNWKNK